MRNKWWNTGIKSGARMTNTESAGFSERKADTCFQVSETCWQHLPFRFQWHNQAEEVLTARRSHSLGTSTCWWDRTQTQSSQEATEGAGSTAHLIPRKSLQEEYPGHFFTSGTPAVGTVWWSIIRNMTAQSRRKETSQKRKKQRWGMLCWGKSRPQKVNTIPFTWHFRNNKLQERRTGQGLPGERWGGCDPQGVFWGDGRGTRPDHRGGCVHTGSTQNGTGPCKKLILLYDISQDGQVTFLSLQRRFCLAKVQPAPGTVREQPLWSDCLDSGPDPRLTGWGTYPPSASFLVGRRACKEVKSVHQGTALARIGCQ